MMSIRKLNKGDISDLIRGKKVVSITGYDLGEKKPIGKLSTKKLNELVDRAKTMIFYEDQEPFPVHTLSIFEEEQLNIENIKSKGMKYDVVLLPAIPC